MLEDRFWLHVADDSMADAGIVHGDLVLIQMQSHAEVGDIVACQGEEPTLKRYGQHGDAIILGKVVERKRLY